jgi:hypothetical protein
MRKFITRPILFLLVTLISLSLTTCKKELSEQEKKEEILQALLSDIIPDSLENDVLWLQNMGTRYAASENHRNLAVKIKKRFRMMGYDNAEIDSFFVTIALSTGFYGAWHYNVIATLEGSLYPDSACVIGSHYDNILSTPDRTVVPGANDNASGIAAVMEVARVMKKNNYSPESTILFIAFDAEEIGLFGSYDFAADPNGFSQEIRFMLNSDMIAYEPSMDPSTWCVNIMDYDNSHTLRHTAEEICARYTALNYRNDNTNNKYSDSYPFFTNGYKALFFFSDKVDPNYHTLNDLASNCNFDYCSEIVKLQCALLADKN